MEGGGRIAAVKKETKEKCVSWLCAQLIRILGRTLRLRISDGPGFLSGGHKQPIIFAYWHNRMLAPLFVYLRHYIGMQRSGERKGAVVLISKSRDGKLISDIIEHLGLGVVSGSSSRGGASALLELTESISNGFEVNITPDGPRGPRYKLSSGLVFLAQKTGAPVCPVHVEYARCFRFKSWDGFMVPLPFSRIEVTFGALQNIAPTGTDEAFEAERSKLEKIMQPVTL
jgi:lysophospholipid acyltransferase (LPLAT)-like uncharacterized protein